MESIGGKVPQVHESFARLCKAIEELSVVVNAVRDGLSPVLHPEPPVPLKGEEKAKTAKAPFAHQIDEQRVQVELVIENLKGIQSRVEI